MNIIKNNKEIIIEKIRVYRKKRRYYDSEYRFRMNIRSLIRLSIKSKGYKKNTKTEMILGLDILEFKNFIESKFESWMSWENYGKYNGMFNYGWDLDHIIPSSFAKTEDEIIKLNHYTNLQPLCGKMNRDIKRAIIY